MAVIRAAEVDRLLRDLCERHSAATTLALHALVGDHVVFRLPAERLRRDLLRLLDRVARGGVGRARHRVRGLAAARDARPREVLARITPGDLALLPRHPHHFGSHAVGVAVRLGAEVADTALDVHLPIRLDDEETIESGGAGDERAHGDADAANLRTDSLPALGLTGVPVEHLGALIKRLLDERARRVSRADRADSPGRTVPFLPAR